MNPDKYEIYNMNGWQKWFVQPAEYLSVLGIIFLVCLAWMPELSSKPSFFDFLHSTPARGRMICRKMISIFGGCFIFFVIEQLVYWCYLNRTYDMSGWNAPMQTIGLFAKQELNLSVLQASEVVLLIKLVFGMIVILVISGVICVVKQVYAVLLFGGVVTLLAGSQIAYWELWTNLFYYLN